MSLDEGDSNVSSTQAGTNGRSYEPTAEELGFFQGVLQQLRNFDWSQHQGNYKTPETATRAHLNSLRNNHGSGWERTRQRGGNIGKPTKYPSHSQICQDPLWRDAKNLASLPDQYLPPFLQPEATLEYHRNFSRDVYDSASKCTKCGKTGSKNGVKFVEGKFVRCDDCTLHALEYCWLTFHPQSRWSGIVPESAYALILPGIRDPNIGPVKFAAPLQADHATDDWDPKHVYNRKTAKYSDIREQKRRFQEILLGDITFLDSNGHNIKTLVDGDAKRANPKFLALRESRKSKKEAFVATLDVGKLVSFATPINHPSTGGNKFDFRGFLQYV